MAFKLKKYSYKALRQLSVQDRLAAAQDREMGQWLLSLLTPSQFVDLFPRYYRESLPDISGFAKAIPSSMSAAKQRAIEEQLNNTTSGSAAGSNYKAGGWKERYQKDIDEQRRATVSKAGTVPPPQLSPEQRKAFEDLKAAPLAADDPRAKMFTGLSEEQLASNGINKVKENGKDVFKYTPKTFTDEEVKQSVKSFAPGTEGLRGTAAVQKSVYDAYRTAGFSDTQARALTAEVGRENGYRENIIFGTHVDPYNKATNLGMISMQGHRFTGLYNYLKGKNLIDGNGNLIRNQATLTAMAQYQKQEMIMGSHGGSSRQVQNVRDFLNNPNINPEDAARILGKDYIRWRYDDPNYAAHHEHRRNYLKQINETLGSRDPLTQDYSKTSMDAAREKLQRQEEEKRMGNIAQYTTAQAGASGGASVTATDKWGGIQPRGTSNWCARGVAHLSKQLFAGNPYFDNASEKGHGDASDFTGGSNFYTNSGMYNPGMRVSEEQINDPKFIESLPPGTIVAASGGRVSKSGKELGHIQMKVGNRWMSDFAQKGFIRDHEGRNYHSYTIMYPSEQGKSYLAKQGFVHSSEPVTNTPPPPVATPKGDKKESPTSVNPSSSEVRKEEEQKPPVPTPANPAPQVSNPRVVKNATPDASKPPEKKVEGKVEFAPPSTTPANPAPQVSNPKVEEKAPATVKTNSRGGVNKINTEQISAYPIGGLNGDNAVVVNKAQKPLFTMNTDEAMTIDPKADTATVMPNSKDRNVGANQPSSLDGMFSEFTQSIRNLSDRFDQNKPVPEKQERPDPFPAEGGAWLGNLNTLTESQFHSPSAARAFSRSGAIGQEQPNNSHFNHGNHS